MADLLTLNQFAVKFNEYSPSGSGQKAHKEHQSALSEAWNTYQETGAVPWGEAATTPTETPEETPVPATEETPVTGETPVTEEAPVVPPPPEQTIEPVPVPEMVIPPPPAADTPSGACTGGLDVGSVNIPELTVTPAPEYEISAEQAAWEEKIGTSLSETIAQGGRGIDQETMDLMTQRTTGVLKAKESEDIRVMKNNMEKRGITNSGFIFSNEQKIRSNTTTAIANSITDLNIQNALLKQASYETAIGQASQFLGYLSEQSQLKAQPKYMTWQAEQQAKLATYQAGIEIKKIQLQQVYAIKNMQIQQGYMQANMQYQALLNANQAAIDQANAVNNMILANSLTQQNMQYEAQLNANQSVINQGYVEANLLTQAQINAEAAAQQHIWDVEIAEMELEASNKQAMASGFGSLVGATIGAIL